MRVRGRENKITQTYASHSELAQALKILRCMCQIDPRLPLNTSEVQFQCFILEGTEIFSKEIQTHPETIKLKLDFSIFEKLKDKTKNTLLNILLRKTHVQDVNVPLC